MPYTPSDATPSLPPRLTAETDRTLVRARARSTRYARVTFTAPEAPRRANRIPVNLALVLDRSGSMAGEKFRLAREAVEQALRQLHPEDHFALVVYDDQVDVLAESTRATPQATRAALERLRDVQPRGTTDLSGGWLRGCEQVALLAARQEHDAAGEDLGERGAARAAISRCLLLTDGLANRGIEDRDELIGHAAALRARGVQTSTFGVGADFDELLLAGMADAAGGHFYFLASAEQIPDLIASEVGEALEVVIRQAALEARLATGMEAEPLGRFHARNVGRDEQGRPVVRIELGDLVSGQEVEAVVRLRFPRGEAGEVAGVDFALVDADGLPCAPGAALRWTWATHAENDHQSRNRVVDRAVATLYAARARSEAVEHNRSGNYDRARRVLTATARRIREYAGNDGELDRIADELLRLADEYGTEALSPAALKRGHFAAYAALGMREVSGKARRRPTRG